MSFKKNRALVIALSMLSSPAGAADAGDAPERAYFEELPIVLTVSRMPQSLAEAPGAVTVIDRDLIRATGYRQLPDLLRLVPGFNVGYLRGWQASVSYHGLAGDLSARVLVLIDGRPINSEFLAGSVDWLSQSLALDDIERIEVLRGFNPAAYGTNAFLGVVNIMTRHASQGRGFYAQVNRGGDGIDDQVLRVGGGFGGLADFRLTLGRRKDDGLVQLADSNRVEFANLRADIRPTATDEFTLNLGVQKSVGGEGYLSEPGNPTRERVVRGSFQQLRWRHAFSTDNELQLQYYRNYDNYIDEGRADLVRVGVELLPITPQVARQQLVLFGLPELLPFDQNRSAQRRSVELQHRFRLSPAVRMGWGGELRRDDAVAATFFDTSEPMARKTERLFANLEWRALPPLLIQLGVMGERVKDRDFSAEALRRRAQLGLSGERVKGSDTDVMPRLFANWELAPGQVLRAGYSEASRAPSLFEARGQQVIRDPRGRPLPAVFDVNVIFGNPDLQRERVSATELNYLGQFPAWRLQIDARLFKERLEHPIDNLRGVPAGNQFINTDELRTRGLEYQVRFEPFRGTSLMLNQAFIRIKGGQTNPAVVGFREAEDFRQSAPTHSTSLMWTQQLPQNLSFSVIQYAVGAIRWLDFGQRVDAYRRTDARVSYRFNGGGLRGEFSLVGLNLFDRYFELRRNDPPETHLFDRRLYGTLRLEF